MISNQEILDFLEHNEAVLTGRHFVYSKGGHGTAYINMRAVAHHSWWLRAVGTALGVKLDDYSIDLVIGPETLGRTLADHAADATNAGLGIWCDMVGEGEDKHAEFDMFRFPQFASLLPGKRVAIVDDLLTTGGSIRSTAELVKSYGGIPAVAGVVVRRTPDVTAEKCGTDDLVVLADIPGFVTYTAAECADHGPCSRRVPVELGQGHGRKWITKPENADYPTA